MADNPKSLASLADDLDLILDRRPEVFEGYLRIVWDPEDCEAIRKAAAALRAPTKSFIVDLIERLEKAVSALDGTVPLTVQTLRASIVLLSKLRFSDEQEAALAKTISAVGDALRAPTIAADDARQVAGDDAALVARLRGEYEPWPKPWMRVVQDWSGRRDCDYFDTESEARQTRKGGYAGDDGVWVEQDPSILTNAAADRIEAAFATPSPTMAADPEVLDCVGECSFRDREHTHYRNTVHVAPSPTIAAPSPSNENTCENDGDRCEYSRTDCAADGSFNCQTHPSPSNEVTAEMVEAGFAAQCEELPEFGNENRENMMRVARVTIEAALKARKPADDGAGQ